MVRLRLSLLGKICKSDEDADDDDAIETCCIPRRFWCMFLAFFIFLYGLCNGLYYLLLIYLHTFSLKQSTDCVGVECDTVISCEATRTSSYHFRLSIMTIGSLYFGHLGILAAVEKYAIEMFQFSCWLLTISVVHATVFVMDIVYFTTCDRHYSYNVIMEAVMWPYRGWPFGYPVQWEVSQMTSYDARYINKLVGGYPVGLWHGIWLCVVASFWLYAAYEAFILSMRFHYGLAGLGTCFSISSWKERLDMRYDVRDAGYGTLGFASAAFDEWDEDEYILQRPIQQGWNRPGFMPGKPVMPASYATAYDGFRDDRRNVLL